VVIIKTIKSKIGVDTSIKYLKYFKDLSSTMKISDIIYEGEIENLPPEITIVKRNNEYYYQTFEGSIYDITMPDRKVLHTKCENGICNYILPIRLTVGQNTYILLYQNEKTEKQFEIEISVKVKDNFYCSRFYEPKQLVLLHNIQGKSYNIYLYKDGLENLGKNTVTCDLLDDLLINIESGDEYILIELQKTYKSKIIPSSSLISTLYPFVIGTKKVKVKPFIIIGKQTETYNESYFLNMYLLPSKNPIRFFEKFIKRPDNYELKDPLTIKETLVPQLFFQGDMNIIFLSDEDPNRLLIKYIEKIYELIKELKDVLKLKFGKGFPVPEDLTNDVSKMLMLKQMLFVMSHSYQKNMLLIDGTPNKQQLLKPGIHKITFENLEITTEGEEIDLGDDKLTFLYLVTPKELRKYITLTQDKERNYFLLLNTAFFNTSININGNETEKVNILDHQLKGRFGVLSYLVPPSLHFTYLDTFEEFEVKPHYTEEKIKVTQNGLYLYHINSITMLNKNETLSIQQEKNEHPSIDITEIKNYNIVSMYEQNFTYHITNLQIRNNKPNELQYPFVIYSKNDQRMETVR